MPRLLVLDASVFVSACHASEPGSEASRALLEAIRTQELPLVEPWLLAVEVAAAVRRSTGKEELAMRLADLAFGVPGLVAVPLDAHLAKQAAALAAAHSLRGAAAVYVATAIRYGAVLVTLDTEQRARSPAAVGACTPMDAWLALRADASPG
jgi:predicted nucleic acid-binding protein